MSTPAMPVALTLGAEICTRVFVDDDWREVTYRVVGHPGGRFELAAPGWYVVQRDDVRIWFPRGMLVRVDLVARQPDGALAYHIHGRPWTNTPPVWVVVDVRELLLGSFRRMFTMVRASFRETPTMVGVLHDLDEDAAVLVLPDGTRLIGAVADLDLQEP